MPYKEDYTKWIDLGAVNSVDIIREMHRLSPAQGLGFLHESSEPLTDAEIALWVEQLAQNGETHLDYVRGRSVKASIHIHEGHYFIRQGPWYDHSDKQFRELLARFGVTLPAKESDVKPHGNKIPKIEIKTFGGATPRSALN